MKAKTTMIVGLLFLCGSLFGQSTFRIVDKPILWDSLRTELSIDYMQRRHGLTDIVSPVIHPRMIVLHWTAIPDLERTFDAFNPVELPDRRPEIAHVSRLNVSSQFLVDRDGTIFRLLPDTVFARHCIGLNYCSIGVENVGSKDASLTQLQVKANIELIKYLSEKYDIEYVIGHHEYYSFIGHELWKETDPNYLTHKVDPGDKFMKKVRAGVKHLHLKGKIE